MRTRLILISSLLAPLVVGCSTLHWEHPHKTAAMLEQDQEDCQVQARAQVPRLMAPPPVVTVTGSATTVRLMDESSLDRQHVADIYQAVQRCLREKGWVLKSN